MTDTSQPLAWEVTQWLTRTEMTCYRMADGSLIWGEYATVEDIEFFEGDSELPDPDTVTVTLSREEGFAFTFTGTRRLVLLRRIVDAKTPIGDG